MVDPIDLLIKSTTETTFDFGIGFFINIAVMGIAAFAVLWKEVINPYRKRDWMKAYFITHGNKLEPVDIKPSSDGYFEHNKGTYFYPREPLTREYKMTVKKAAIYKEGESHPLLYEVIDTTKGKLKSTPKPKEITEAIKDKKTIERN